METNANHSDCCVHIVLGVLRRSENTKRTSVTFCTFLLELGWRFVHDFTKLKTDVILMVSFLPLSSLLEWSTSHRHRFRYFPKWFGASNFQDFVYFQPYSLRTPRMLALKLTSSKTPSVETAAHSPTTNTPWPPIRAQHTAMHPNALTWALTLTL